MKIRNKNKILYSISCRTEKVGHFFPEKCYGAVNELLRIVCFIGTKCTWRTLKIITQKYYD